MKRNSQLQPEMRIANGGTLRWKKLLAGFLADENASELVEFALAVCIWIGFIFGVIYLSFALYSAHFVANAAEQGARFAAVRGSSWSNASCSTAYLACTATDTDVSNYILSTLAPGMTVTNLSITTTWPGTDSAGNTCDSSDGKNSPNCIVQVQVQYSYNYPLPFARLQAMQMSSVAKMTIVE